MNFDFQCNKCKKVFEKSVSAGTFYATCPECKGRAKRQFHATSNFHIPLYFHTSRSDIFSHEEWQDLKKDPNVERAK